MRPPFDHEHLNAPLDAVAVDLLRVNPKHNVQYLLGGYRFFFHGHMAAMGLVRSLPLLALPAGRFEARSTTAVTSNPGRA